MPAHAYGEDDELPCVISESEDDCNWLAKISS